VGGQQRALTFQETEKRKPDLREGERGGGGCEAGWPGGGRGKGREVTNCLSGNGEQTKGCKGPQDPPTKEKKNPVWLPGESKEV